MSSSLLPATPGYSLRHVPLSYLLVHVPLPYLLIHVFLSTPRYPRLFTKPCPPPLLTSPSLHRRWCYTRSSSRIRLPNFRPYPTYPGAAQTGHSGPGLSL
jgi:hypothetical protein